MTTNDQNVSQASDDSSHLHIATDDVRKAYEEKKRAMDIKMQEEIAADDAQEAGLPYINLQDFPIGPEAIGMIPEKDARARRVVCIFANENEIRVASPEPDRPEVQEIVKKLKEEHQAHVVVSMISDDGLERALTFYKGIPKRIEMKSNLELTKEELEKFGSEVASLEKLAEALPKVPVTSAFSAILSGAIQTSASDIHIEAEENDVKIRYRLDGILHDIAAVPKEFWKKIISRIKIVSGMKINVDNVPQDGRITIQTAEETLDIRVSALPTAYGESVVMRLLRPSTTALSFDELGLRGRAYADLKREVERPNGMIVTTGPTGSGKTTTLYAIMNKLNIPAVKMITLEDPIEYKLKGVNQSQVDHAAGYDFAKGLRSLLRQDPDIVMVGEIRDGETADIAIQAALTGHLVLSTVHTNDAAGAIPRFLSMGAQPHLLAPALNAVIGQRLVRRLCKECKEPATLGADILRRVEQILTKIPGDTEEAARAKDVHALRFFTAKGCAACHNLGYKGRVGIYEIFAMNPDIERVILSNQVSEYAIQELAVGRGMITMVQDGLLKALDGITSVDEVFRVAEEKSV